MSEPSFLIVRLGSLGDVVHAIPAAAAVRRHLPGARLDWLVDPRYVELLELVEGIDHCIAFDPRDLLRGTAAWSAVGRLRHTRYDAVLDLQGLLKSAALAWAVGAGRTIGFDASRLREPQARFFYSETPDIGSATHVIDKGLGLVRALGVPADGASFPLRVPWSAAAAAVVGRHGEGGYVLLNPGAAWPNKRWPAERFGALAAAIRGEHGLSSVVLWGPDDESLAASVVAASDGAAETAPSTRIVDIVAMAHGARLMVSGDTGPLHLAGAVGTPLVALFGPTVAERNGPWDSADVTLSRVATCSCVYERRCRKAARCIDDITVDEVVHAVRRRLDRHD